VTGAQVDAAGAADVLVAAGALVAVAAGEQALKTRLKMAMANTARNIVRFFILISLKLTGIQLINFEQRSISQYFPCSSFHSQRTSFFGAFHKPAPLKDPKVFRTAPV
jgi:hypothetical protein